MRTVSTCILSLMLVLLLVNASPVNAQYRWKDNFYGGFGLTFGTMNFKQNGAGAFIVPVRYDFLYIGKSSISLATRPSFGSEDEYGISFPIIVILFALLDAGGAHTANFTNNYNDDGKGYSIRAFADLPILLQYNFGLGTRGGEDDALGFYVNGGGTYTFTGYTYEEGHQRQACFWGLQAGAGLRFRNGLELGLSVTRPFENPIGPIRDPLLCQISFCAFRK